tara:strand:+ start:3052 stop:3309 length:258 start_codon:yes stop_codon:yes gene_type:complete
MNNKENENETFQVGDQTLVNTYYSDWFGNGCVKNNVERMTLLHGKPEKVLVCENTTTLLCYNYKDKIVVHGYDGNEYMVNFVFKP